jgi:quinolinate synthase
MTQISERLLVQAHLDAKQPKPLTAAEEAHYRAAIAAELKAQDAVLVAHFYCDPIIQALAEETGGWFPIPWKWPGSVTPTRPRPWWWPA